METNLLILVLVAVASISIIYFFIRQNLENKNELLKELFKENEVSIMAEHENDSTQPEKTNRN